MMCLNYQELENSVSDESNYLSVLEAERKNPNYCGIYAIRIKDLNFLPQEIVEFQQNYAQTNNIIYIGMANPATLAKRLIGQDLNNKGAAIFFRKLGSILDKIAVQGSGKNYRFNEADKRFIIQWIKQNLEVKYYKYPSVNFSKNETTNEYEKPLIRTFTPAFNDNHNPYKCHYIKQLHLRNRDIGLNRI